MESRLLLRETNPYGSREAVVEDDGRTVYLYLRGIDGNPEVRGASVWVANRLPAPLQDDFTSAKSGVAPLMPASHTQHPQGWADWDPKELSLLWFEEGDGVVLLSRGRPLAVLPPWSDPLGCSGYAREAIGHHLLAWALDMEAMEGLGPRIEASRAYWHWRGTQQSWVDIEAAGLRHLEPRLGEQKGYWEADGGTYPPRAVVLFQPPAHPGISIYTTLGMSAQAMPQVERYFEDPAPHRRVELALAYPGESEIPIKLLAGMMGSPWKRCTWLGTGHTYGWSPPSAERGASAVLLLRYPPPDVQGRLFRRSIVYTPDLSGLEDRSGDPVTYLWVVPITAAEADRAKAKGSQSLVQELERAGRGWVWR